MSLRSSNVVFIHFVTCSFLGYTDLQGTAYEENFVCSGLGLHLSMPLVRNGWRADMTKAEAEELLKTCLSVLFYRDSSTINRVRRAVFIWLAEDSSLQM